MKIVEKGGKVAVLYSPDYGRGWSTEADYADRESICMNAEIVQPFLDNCLDEATAAVQRLHPRVYVGDIGRLRVEWVPAGSKFEIEEYDGREWITVVESVEKATYRTYHPRALLSTLRRPRKGLP